MHLNKCDSHNKWIPSSSGLRLGLTAFFRLAFSLNQVSTLINPRVYILSEDSAAIAYVNLTQHLDNEGSPKTRQTEETRSSTMLKISSAMGTELSSLSSAALLRLTPIISICRNNISETGFELRHSIYEVQSGPLN